MGVHFRIFCELFCPYDYFAPIFFEVFAGKIFLILPLTLPYTATSHFPDIITLLALPWFGKIILSVNSILNAKIDYYSNPLSANPTIWSNTLNQFVGNLPTNCLSVFDDFVRLALKWLKLLQRRIFIDDCAYSVLIYWFWNLRLLSFISSSVACRCTFKHVNPFGFPIFLSIGIWMLEIWRRHTVELSRNNSFISSFVTFVFKFTIYNSCFFASVCWLDWFCCFSICWSKWRWFYVCFGGAIVSFFLRIVQLLYDVIEVYLVV